jgi:hypothetical protein
MAFSLVLPGPAAFAQGEGKYERTKTPIKHLVVIFDENISFDHYFDTYPHALNPAGEPKFIAAPDTPAVNGLTPALLHNNPNLNKANGAGAANPFRLGRNQASTADQDNDYSPEQMAFHGGKMDLFPLKTGTGATPGQLYYPISLNAEGPWVPEVFGDCFLVNGKIDALPGGRAAKIPFSHPERVQRAFFATDYGKLAKLLSDWNRSGITR